MALIGCEQSGRTSPPKIHQKVVPPAQEIALFLHSCTRTSMACQKEKKSLEKKRLLLLRLLSLVLVEMWKYSFSLFLFLVITLSPHALNHSIVAP